jgi:hypothetical protein
LIRRGRAGRGAVARYFGWRAYFSSESYRLSSHYGFNEAYPSPTCGATRTETHSSDSSSGDAASYVATKFARSSSRLRQTYFRALAVQFLRNVCLVGLFTWLPPYLSPRRPRWTRLWGHRDQHSWWCNLRGMFPATPVSDGSPITWGGVAFLLYSLAAAALIPSMLRTIPVRAARIGTLVAFFDGIFVRESWEVRSSDRCGASARLPQTRT